MNFVVAIDGPAGSGKGTITKLIGKELGLVYIDTGATFRATALNLLQNGIKIDEEDKIKNLLEKIDIEQFKKETAMYNDLIKGLDRATSQEELKEELNNIYQKMGWKKPWEGDFDDFMTNSNKPMVFE